MNDIHNRPRDFSRATNPANPVRRIPSTSLIVFLVTIQSILFLGHWFVYQTWTFFRAQPDPPGITPLQGVFIVLSLSFLTSSLLAFRYTNALVRLFYKIAATWLGFLNFFFLAACLCWLAYLGTRVFSVHWPPQLATAAFAASALTGIYGLLNARQVRVKEIAVRLANLPASWRGRVAALVTDTHLGHVNGQGFMRKIVHTLAGLKPDVVFIAGDLYDGSKVDLERVVAPWKQFSPPLGAYFVTGNHEEFSDRGKYLEAIAGAGIRILNNEKVMIDGLQLVGVHDRELGNPDRLRSILEASQLDRARPSILLAHVPQRLEVSEQAGISLQLSGHTHGGQMVPFTWITQRIFGEYTYGLRRFRDLTVYTSSGAGTWGPPMRVGTQPEIVMLRLETA